MSTPKGYVDSNYLQAAAKLLQQTKQRSYTYMQIQSGHKVLDVGCGSSTDTIPLAHLVGSTGYVAGIDYDDAMVSEANRHAKEARVSAWVTHKRADATSLPFASGEFDSSRSERLFQHLLNPEKALSEMVRVTKLGGWVVVLDTDWGTLSTDTPEIDIERRIVRVHTERCLHNGYSGRQLYRLFKRETLVDISIEMFPTFVTNYALGRQMLRLDEIEQEALAADIITSDELQRWRDSLERAEAEGVFFGTVSMVLVVGRKT